MTLFRKRHPPVGSRPGTLVGAEDAVAPRIAVIQYTPERVSEKTVEGVTELESLRREGGITWIDVQGLGDHELLRELARIFGLHALALEDVVNAPQRPKTESFEEHQLYISRMVTLGSGMEIDIEQVSIFVGEGYVLTFQERHGDVLDPVRERLRQGTGPMRRSGPDYLAYAIIDTIIDYYYPVIDMISDELETLEARVMTNPTNATLGAINRMKRSLLELRRGIWPQRDAINAIVRGDSRFFAEPTRVYLRDSYDHVIQINDVIETYREIAGGLFNTYLSVVSNRMNEVMKVLTIMASIFIPLTFLAGIYGMNFEAMPELHVAWAYPVLLATMLVVGVGMVFYFRNKGWIGAGKDPDDEA